MAKPAHKQDDPAKMPGQIKNDVTLRDYIQRNCEHKWQQLYNAHDDTPSRSRRCEYCHKQEWF